HPRRAFAVHRQEPGAHRRPRDQHRRDHPLRADRRGHRPEPAQGGRPVMTPYVLVVEDEDALATLLDYNLSREGYQVALAGDGEEALLKAAEKLPDLVILDWMLPKVSGIEVCRRLRQRPETRNVPIIMLTARGEESDRIRGLDTGADDYVVKP